MPGVEGQKAQLLEEGQRSAFYAVEQVGQVAVEIVVDLHTTLLDGTAHGHRAAAAEHINEPAVVIRRHLVDDPQ